MTEFLYRFRTVKRLLGDEVSVGELAGQYIYFASPEQLNDPLEGHRNLFFSGDDIVWSNLFKYYITCLLLRNFQYFALTELDDFDYDVVHALECMPPEITIKADKLKEKFISNDVVAQHIESLASDERRVTRHELLIRLRSVHVYALHLIALIMQELGIDMSDSPIVDMTEEDCLHRSKSLVLYTKGVNSFEFEPALYAAESEQLVRNYNAFRRGENKTWHKITVNFVDDFMRSLRSLSHEKWYTACFMGSCSNSAIWGSYGDNHAGVCLKFRPTIAPDSETRTLPFNMPVGYGHNGDIFGNAYLEFSKVVYEGNPPELDFFRSIGAYSKSQLLANWYTGSGGELSTCADVIKDEKAWRENYWARRLESLTTKMPDWNSENEYRIILESMIPSFANKESRCLKYEFESLEGIIFGIKTPDEDKYELICEVEKLCEKFKRVGFNFYQAYHDVESKAIKYRHLITVNCGDLKS